MCGRYVLINGHVIFAVSAQLQTWRNEGREFDVLPKYDARPTNLMPVVCQRDGKYVVNLMRWSLVPHWSKDGKSDFATFNAKSETLHSSKLFAPYFKSARCLVPASGFFEWKKYITEVDDLGNKGKKKTVEKKQKMYICMKNEEPFMMAGLFSVWKKQEGDKIEEFPTYTIITTEPNELLTEIHNRMPVILHPKDYEVWLNRDMHDIDFLKTLLVPFPADTMQAYAVTNFSEESPKMIEKIEYEAPKGADLVRSTKPIVAKKPKKK